MQISSIPEYEKFILSDFTNLKLLVFLSDSIDQSKAFESLLLSNLQLFTDQKISIGLIKDTSEATEDIFSQYQVEMVPTSVLLNANLSDIERFQGVSPGEILTRSAKHLKTFQQSLELEQVKYKQTLNRVFNDRVFILFEFLKDRNKDYAEARRLLEERQLSVRRQSTMPFKEDRLLVILGHLGFYFAQDYAHYVSNPYPLVYFDKRVVSDITALHKLLEEKAEIIDSLKKTEESNVRSILANNKAILFVNSDDPNYKEQERVLKALQERKVMFTYLDIATKPGILSILRKVLGKESLQLATLVIDGKEVHEQTALSAAQPKGFEGIVRKELIVESVDDRIRLILESAPVVLFIKGTPEFPQCGFTRQVIELMLGQKVKFGYYNILADNELRERLRTYSSWETYPQVYVNKELIGGIDICRELIETGDFKQTFAAGIEK